MPKLGVNIDHVATLREARKITIPDPVEAALLCEKAGCDSIVCHLREDRRHIKEDDVIKLRRLVTTRLNLEMSIASDIVSFACTVKPDQATLVPERRKELTTEGGLDVIRFERRIASVVSRLDRKRIGVSLFIDPSKKAIDASRRTGARIIELHTGDYANATSESRRKKELQNLKHMVAYAVSLGFEVNAGHGLNYENAKAVAMIGGMHELNIGHAIISRSIFVGLGKAVEEMVGIVR